VSNNVSCLGGAGNVAEADCDVRTETPLSPNKCKLFQVFLLMNDDDQSVWVMETPEIDLEVVISSLKMGDSVFIHCKESSELGVNNAHRTNNHRF